ncbi:MAG: IS21 family transposase [Candidatus Anammoxibacter sp.]
MPTESISMRKLKEILRLKYKAKLSNRMIGTSLSISPGTVSIYINRAKLMGIEDWPLPIHWDDLSLHKYFIQTKIKPRTAIPLPDWGVFHPELKKKGVTKQLLWQEYVERNSDNHYSYPQMCRIYNEWLSRQQPSMRQTHKYGEKLFIDYCGPTIPIVNPETGEFYGVQIFVAVMGGSNYTFAEATLSQKLEDWIMSHVRAFQFFGAVPDIIVPDNLRSATTRACKYDPDLNPTYQQLAAHYNVAIIPARPLKPKDKAKAENGVLIVERWIMAVLRHEIFCTLTHLNQRISELLLRLNTKEFQKLPGNRTSEFRTYELPAMKPLPLLAYQYTFIKKVKVSIDYHIEVNKHYYSVPYGLIKKQIEAHVSEQTVKLYYHNQCVASHLRSHRIGGYSTKVEHMPKAHQDYAKWNPERLKQWAGKLGEYVLQWVEYKLANKDHPQQSYKVCFGLLSLSKTYSKERLNDACQRALDTGGYRLENIKIILKNNLDKEVREPKQTDLLEKLEHDNVRGQEYYQ